MLREVDGNEGYPVLPAKALLNHIGKGPGVFLDIGGLALRHAGAIRETATWTHVATGTTDEFRSDLASSGVRLFHERPAWELPMPPGYAKAAHLRLPSDPAPTTRLSRSLTELFRVLQPEAPAVISTRLGGLHEERLSRVLRRYHFDIAEAFQQGSGSVAKDCNPDGNLIFLVRAKWRAWMR